MQNNNLRLSLCERDSKLIWHPFTQHKIAETPLPIVKAKGSYLIDESNNKYLDLVSSWWVNLHGHCNSHISKAISEQCSQLEHVMFAGFTHEPAVKLAENLKTILPANMQKFFYSDNGSTSTEIALKMSYQYFLNQGISDKTLFICFEGAYHGDTFGAMSVGKSSGFHDNFQKFFFETLTIPYPHTFDGDDEIEKKEQESINKFIDLLSKYKDKIAAFILEPIMQGASGMRMTRTTYINKILKIAKEHGILIIFDEVMTGFGRLGTNFASCQLDVSPDFICLSKGLSGGFLPLALTVTTEEIFSAFLNDDINYLFSHGHTFTGNPIACAAANASFELLMNDETQKIIKNYYLLHQEGTKLLRGKIKKLRICGTLAAFEIENPKNIQNLCIKKGFLVRPLANILYLVPPYCTSHEEIMCFYEYLSSIL